MNTKKTTTRPFSGSDRVPSTSGGQTSLSSCSIPNRKRTQRRPQRDHFGAQIGSPPTSRGQTDDFCTFGNHMEMHACGMHMHMHICKHTPTSTHEMRTRTHVHKHCLRPYANAIAFLMQTLGRCLAELENGRRGPKAASSNFEHKPWKPQDGVKVTTVLHF